MRTVFAALVVGASFVACSKPASPPSTVPGTCPGSDALVAVSDYTSSGVGSLALDGGGALAFGADLGTDPALAVSRGRAFYVARKESRVLELDACGRAKSEMVVSVPSFSGSVNPQDVAAAPDGSVWVPLFATPAIAIAESGHLTPRIDLSSYDPDGNPQASAIRIVDVGGAAKAFVALERLDPLLRPTQTSAMLRIDVATRAVEATITLAGRNPFAAMFEDSGVLFLAEPGDFNAIGEPAAGIERFDTTTSATRILVPESSLDASAVEVAIAGHCGAVIVADPTPTVNATSLVTFDADTGAVLAKGVLAPSPDFDNGLRGLAWVEGGRVLLVGDRRRQDRGYPVHAFDRDDACTLQPRTDVIFVSQKPISVRPSP